MGKKMQTFISENFLLQNKTAIRLYHEYAEGKPIIDYHCHISPKETADDRRFENITQVWLSGDHYKWRAMRTNGIDETLISGSASDWDKFLAWANTVPKTIRNPLYHWTHMELKKPFGIVDKFLNKDTAKEIWEHTNSLLARKEFSCRGLIKQANVEVVCTTDDPTDSLEHHANIASDSSFNVLVVPAFRPDKGMAVEQPVTFKAWIKKLAEVSKTPIRSYSDYIHALRKRHEFFHSMGCRVSDHGLETAYAEDYKESEAKTIFKKLMAGKKLTSIEILKFKSAMLYEFGMMDWERGWVQQFHLGALRNTNSRLFRTLGPDTGFDTIGDFEQGRPLAKLLSRLDDENKLAKTIIYNLNPRDNELMASMIGCFQDGSVAGKIQYGSAWWFLDQKDGIENQLRAISNLSLLSRFVGMLTDSRSFLSYSRHEYFRRILCNILGEDIEKGLLPNDLPLIGGMVTDICYTNAKEYFGFQRK
jgi:glucuronate isomerase